MKIWIECRQDPAYDRRYYLWRGTAPKWNDHYGCWWKRTGIGRYFCIIWLNFFFDDSSFVKPEPGELVELEINHLETWEMK